MSASGPSGPLVNGVTALFRIGKMVSGLFRVHTRQGNVREI